MPLSDSAKLRRSQIDWLHPTGYEATSSGDVMSLPRKGRRALFKLKPMVNQDGYLFVTLQQEGQRKNVMIHQLVASKYLPPKPKPDYQVRHLNGVKTDNRHTNLSWGTAKQNADDREMHGNTAKGERNAEAKLSAEDVVCIRASYTGKWGEQTKLARVFGITRVQIANVVQRKSWRHLP